MWAAAFCFRTQSLWVFMPWNLRFSSWTYACPMPGCERRLRILASIALSLEIEMIAALRCPQWVSPTGILQSVSKVAFPIPTPQTSGSVAGCSHTSYPTWVVSKNQISKTCNREPLYKCGGCIEYHVTHRFWMAKVTIEELAAASKLASPCTVFPWAAVLKTACCCCCFPPGFLCLEPGTSHCRNF